MNSKKKNWNNARKPGLFWLCVWGLAIFPLFLNERSFLSFRDNVDYFRHLGFNFSVQADHIWVAIQVMVAALLITLVVFIIGLALARYPAPINSRFAGSLRFLGGAALWADVIVGCILEYCAVYGFMGSFFKKHSFTWFAFLALLVFLSYYYWHSVIPIFTRRKLWTRFSNEQKYREAYWYSISNAPSSLSSFSQLPGLESALPLVIDGADLNAAGKAPEEVQAFSYCLVGVDERYPCSEEFIAQFSQIRQIPHMNILLCCSENNEHESTRSWLKYVSNYRNVTVRCFNHLTLKSDVDLKHLLDVELPKKKNNVWPAEFLADDWLRKNYLSSGVNIELIHDFLHHIINNLEPVPAIYALFDFIDLQYRLAIAYHIAPDNKWMKKRGRVIGNISIMAQMLSKPDFYPTKYHDDLKYCGEHFPEMFSAKEWQLIKKYLPNYEVHPDASALDTVSYLTSNLRNVLRGHGSFAREDSHALFTAIFKLAIYNLSLLQIAQLILTPAAKPYGDQSEFFAIYGAIDGIEKLLSPFLVYTKNNSLLVFNNWYSEDEGQKSLEYINYLDGNLILPTFQNIASK